MPAQTEVYRKLQLWPVRIVLEEMLLEMVRIKLLECVIQNPPDEFCPLPNGKGLHDKTAEAHFLRLFRGNEICISRA